MGHRAADHDVRPLRALEEGKKALVIIGAVRGIDVEGHRMAGADRVEADTALKAGTGAPAEFALHFVLGDEVLRASGHVQEAVCEDARDVTLCAAEIRPLGGEAVGLRHGVDRGEDDRMLDRLLDALAHEEHVYAPAAQRRDVVVGGDDWPGKIGPELLLGVHAALLWRLYDHIAPMVAARKPAGWALAQIPLQAKRVDLSFGKAF